MSRRSVSLGLSILILTAFFSLLGWALARSGGVPGGVGVNNDFGEVSIQERPAPDFTLDLLDGGTITLSDLKGKLVLVDFWASWCPPCREEAPGLAQVYKEYKDRGVEFIGISVWDRVNDAKDYVQRFGITYLSGLDSKGTILVDYGVRGIPEKFFINPEGQLIAKFIGPSDVDGLWETLDQMLADQN
ncbi:MAG: TlpA disulfide reductase family protein [Chloroflexi bacterium]|nr:TlpA disulfide reductase family protein [Chloroflexota bacterium]